jgi:hypothetical protein
MYEFEPSEHPTVRCYPPTTRRDGPTADQTALPADVRETFAEPGKPLSPQLRERFESHMGADFSRVRVHTGDKAASAAASIRALAFTVGHDIVFAAGQLTPNTAAGSRLLAHELGHVVEQGAARSAHRPEQSSSMRGAMPVAVARQADPHAAPDSARKSFLRAVDRGDAIGIRLNLTNMSEPDRLVLARDEAVMSHIDRRLPAAVRLRIRMQLQFGDAPPADVKALLRAATDRDAKQVAAVLSTNVRLRDPGDFPGLLPALKSIFAGHPDALRTISEAAVISKQEMLDFARRSPHLAEQERQTGETVRRAEGRAVGLETSTADGQTLTNTSAAAIYVSAPGGRRDFAIKYSHELSNLNRSVQGRDEKGRPGWPRVDQYASGDAYATGVLEWEAWSIVDRAIVAAELNIGTDWIAKLGRSFKAGQITRAEMFRLVVGRLEEFTVTNSAGRSIPARQNYRQQWETAHARP